jgi:hypothetical protein
MTRNPTGVELDGFTNYTDETDGDDDALNTPSRAIVGLRLKFVDPRWTLEGEDVTGESLTLIDMRKVVSKWGHDRKPLETRILLPDQKWPDLAKLNSACDRGEWRDSFGKWIGPWAGQRCLYFIDANYRRITWASPKDTLGSKVCIDDAMKDIQLVRKFRGPSAFVVFKLSHTDWRTAKAGLKQRPKLVIDGPPVMLSLDRVGALPNPDAAPMINAAPVNTTIPQGAPADAQPVAPRDGRNRRRSSVLIDRRSGRHSMPLHRGGIRG